MDDVTISLPIEQAWAVQSAITTQLYYLHETLDRWKEDSEMEGCNRFTREQIENLEAARAILKEAFTCTP